MLLHRVIDSDLTGGGLNSLRWMVLHDPRPKHLLLTSDRPVVMTNGLDKANSNYSSRSRRAMCSRPRTMSRQRATSARFGTTGSLFQQMNERVALQSRKYVWGLSNAQLSFVAKRLGKAWTADPLENLTTERMLEYARTRKLQT